MAHFDLINFRHSLDAADLDTCGEMLKGAEETPDTILAMSLMHSGVVNFKPEAYLPKLLSIEGHAQYANLRQVLLAETRWLSGDNEAAVRALTATEQATLQTDPDYRFVVESLAIVAYASGYDDIAARSATKLAKMGDATGHNILGWVALRRGGGLRVWAKHLVQSIDRNLYPISGARRRGQIAYSLATVARELPLNEYGWAAHQAYADVEWTPALAEPRFQATRMIAWMEALAGDQVTALRWNRQSLELAYSPLAKIYADLDHAVFLRAFGRYEHSVGLARSIYAASLVAGWDSARDEARGALLLLADVLAPTDPSLALQCLARYRGSRLLSYATYQRNLREDRRVEAFTAFPTAVAFHHLGDAELADHHYRHALNIFDEWEMGWRAARAAMGLADLHGDREWLVKARGYISPWPRSWIAHEINDRLNSGLVRQPIAAASMPLLHAIAAQ